MLVAIRWSIPVVSVTAPNIIADRTSHTVVSMLDMPPRESSSSRASLPQVHGGSR
jgi:hypothetical protein